MTSYESPVEQYITIWNEDDETARRALVEQLFTDGAHYLDPLVSAAGQDAIVSTITAVRGQFPDWIFQLLGDVDAHNNVIRFRWTLSPDGTAPADDAPIVGFDVATLTEDGRIDRVIGFLDRVPVP